MEKLLCIVGTNASGKSALGIELAKRLDAEVVSADSRQVYRGLDLGSGKVTKEEMQGIKHHLIDVAKPNDFFSLAHYQRLAYEATDEIIAGGHRAILVGGTGLYVNAVVDGYTLTDTPPDPGMRKFVEQSTSEELIKIIEEKAPAMLSRLDLNNKRRLERAAEKAMEGSSEMLSNRPRYETLLIGVTYPRQELYERIKIRLDKRLDEGMIEEVSNLRKNGASDDFLYRLGLEYRYILMYLRNEFDSYDAFYDKLFMEIRHLAKEQMTWFRKRRDITWIDMKDDPVGVSLRLAEGFYKTGE